MAHREDIRAYLEGLTVHGVAIDWGSGSKPVSKYVKSDGATFITVDQNTDVKPDYLYNINESVYISEADHAFCMEVIEHTVDPEQVFRNIYENLKEGGTLHLSVPFMFPEHGDNDYLRLTSRGLKYFAELVGFKDIKVWEITDGFLMEAIK